MVSQSRDGLTLLKLVDVVRDIDELNSGLAIYAAHEQPVEVSTPVALVNEEIDDPPNGMSYLLEVHLVRDVLRVWKLWRPDREPTLAEACAAVSYYASRDAYQPTDEE